MNKMAQWLLAVILSLLLSVAVAGAKQPVDTAAVERSINLRFFIPGLFVGYIGGVWDIAVSRSISVGPIVRVFTYGKYEGYDFGLNMNYALSGNLSRSGFVLNPYIEYYNGNYDQPFNAFGVRPKESSIVVGMTLMYQWMFHNGFNIMGGLGLEYSQEPIPATMIGDSDLHGHYEVTIGYAF